MKKTAWCGGGPAWLFAFAVIAGVLMGNTAAIAAILMNALSPAFIIILVLTGRWGHDVFFSPAPGSWRLPDKTDSMA